MRTNIGWAVLVVTGACLGPRAYAQDAAPLLPAPAQAVATSREAALEERLRKMEEMNQALSRTVQDLSKKLDGMAAPSGGNNTPSPLTGGLTSPESAAAAIEEAAGEGVPFSGGITPTPLSGGLTSPMSAAAISSRPGSNKRLPLKTFYDEDYRQRYGFVLQSENQEFLLRFNGLTQFDARIYQPSQSPVVSDLDIPRTRMFFSGRLTRPIEYQISFQRSTNSFDLLNAYLNFHYDDRLQVRAGRFRAPFTYEWAKLSIWELPTPERSPFAINFGPNRQVGLMGWGNVLSNRLEYAVGIFDGPRNSYQDFNSAKDVMAFLDFRPFFDQDAKTPGLLNALSVGGSLDAGHQDNPLSPGLLRGSTTASGNTLTTGSGDSLIAVPYLAFNNNVRERGDRALWELHTTYFYKSLGLLAAWDSGRNDFSLTTRGAQPVKLPISGYFVQATYMLTGETREKITLIEPLHPFDLRSGSFGLGALELQARYSELAVGREVFTGGLADPNLWTNRAEFIDAGFNWYLNKHVKFMFDWQHAMFDQPVYSRPGVLQSANNLYWLRLQCYF